MTDLIGKKEIVKQSGVPMTTFNRWLRLDKIKPVAADEQGKPLFSREQIDEAKALHHPEFNSNKQSVSADASESLFNVDVPDAEPESKSSDKDTEPVEQPADDEHDAPSPETVLSGSCVDDVDEPINLPTDGDDVQDARADYNVVGVVPTDTTLPADINADVAASAATVDFDNPVVDDTLLADSDSDIDYINIEPEKNAVSVVLSEKATDLVNVPADVPTEGSITLEQRADRIKNLFGQITRAFIDIGLELIAAKKEVGHGDWGAWLQTEFSEEYGLTERTARNYMNVAERFGNRKTFSDLNSSTLIKMLTLPEGDEDAFVEAQAAAGRPIEKQSAREVKKNVDAWKQSKTVSVHVAPADADPRPTKVKAVVEIPAELQPAAKRLPPLANHTGNYEWYTPTQYIDAARHVLGDIDLDPASCDLANQTVKAKEFFAADTDGLEKDWRGRVWLNPPFASGLIERFVDKLVGGVVSGDIPSAICLVHNCTETAWFRRLVEGSSAVVFTDHRINFVASDGTLKPGTSQRGQAFLYFGDEPENFFDAFQQFGYGMTKYSPSDANGRKGTNNE